MNRLNLIATSSLFAIAATAAHAAPVAPTVLNLNATISGGQYYNTLAPSFYQTVNLAAGTYTVTAINGVYSGWDQTSPNTSASWEERIGIDQGNAVTFSNANGNNVYTPYPNTDPQAFSGLYANAAAALAAAQPYTLVVTTAGPVTFYIPDQSYPTYPGYSDNSGGVSLSIAPAPTPEPSSLVLLGTGALGLAGAVRRRFIS